MLTHNFTWSLTAATGFLQVAKIRLGGDFLEYNAGVNF